MADGLVIVKPETFLKWHRTAFRAFGDGSLGSEADCNYERNRRELIREMAHGQSDLGEERIADELKLKLGTRISPRTVRKYLDRNLQTEAPISTGPRSFGWSTCSSHNGKCLL